MDSGSTAKRLTLLEASLRRTRRLTAALGLALCGVVTLAATQGQGKVPAVLRVKRLIADDIRLGAPDSQYTTIKPGFVVLNTNKNSIILGTTPDRADIKFVDETKVTPRTKAADVPVRLVLGYHGDETRIAVTDASNTLRIGLGHSDAVTGLILSDESGKRAHLGEQVLRSPKTGSATDSHAFTLRLWGEKGELLHRFPR